jgi:hypothetical protein
MDRCVFVSANAGWNLLIGTAAEGKGAWIALDEVGLPEACKTVFEEAAKDACFMEAGHQRIAAEPLAWLSLVPRKLGATFDYPSAAAAYLREAGPNAFSAEAAQTVGATELAAFRLLMLLGLVYSASARGPRRSGRMVCALLGGFALVLPWGSPSVVALLVCAAQLGKKLSEHFILLAVVLLLALTAAVHSVFFGAGRYALVAGYLMAALAGPGLAAVRASFTRARSGWPLLG